MAEFRKARLIHLHNERLRIQARGEGDAAWGNWVRGGNRYPSFAVAGSDLRRIFESLGLETFPWREECVEGNEAGNKGTYLDGLEYNYFNVEMWPADSSVDELLVRIDGPQQFSIKYMCQGENDLGEPVNWWTEATYHGSASVFWSEEVVR